MTTVSVDLDDLEKLLFATVVITQIEAAFQQRSNDPFVKPHLEYKEASDRLLQVLRNEQRKTAGTATDYDAELTDNELKILRDAAETRVLTITPDYRLKTPAIDTLAAKGCIVLGQCANAIVWAGANRPELKVDPSKFAVKITDRGREKLNMLNERKKVV